MGNCLGADATSSASASAANLKRLFRSNQSSFIDSHERHPNKSNQQANVVGANGSSNGRHIPDLLTGDSHPMSRSSATHMDGLMNLPPHLMAHDGTGGTSSIGSNNNINLLKSSDNRNNKSSLVSNIKNCISNSTTTSANNTFNAKTTTSSNNNGLDQQRTMICLTDFVASREGELDVRKGDRLMVIDTNNPDWFFAEHVTGKRKGFVPRNYLASEAIEMEEWFFPKTSRREAEKLLLSGNNCRGTFLVRNSEQDHAGYSLSIRDIDQKKGDHVKHYKIKRLDNGGYYVATRSTFRTMTELIAFYSKGSNGLCHKLVKPCPKPKPSFWPDRGDELDRSELKFLRKIGAGCFGEVYHGCYRKETEVAIKVLKEGTMSPQAFMEEARIMRQCRNPSLVALYGVCTSASNSGPEPLLIITEYCCNGSLLEFLRNNPEGKSLKLPDLLDMASQVANGMAYLEQMRLIHRDLAARNVLVAENNICKIADFGLARLLGAGTEKGVEGIYEARQGAKFPIKWTAPEAAMYGKFSIKSDVWSYGVVCYEIISKGALPYSGMSNQEVLSAVEKGYRMPLPPNCPPAFYNEIIYACWNKDPQKRPTFATLKWKLDDFFESDANEYRDAAQFIK